MKPAAGAEGIVPPVGLIAGNGRFPLLSLEEAIRRRIPVVVAAIREEAEPEIADFAARAAPEAPVAVHWIGLGQLGKLIDLFRRQGVRTAIMAGQVRHVRIFAAQPGAARRLLSALPDGRMLRLLASLPRRDTESLIGGIADALRAEGIELLASTALLGHLIAEAGVLTKRAPNRSENRDIEYGRPLARQLAGLDLGQTIVVKDQAVVAVEAMEGTDETIRRASRLTGGRRLTVVKAGRPCQDMRFDVPVVGLDTLKIFRQCNVSALAIDAGRTLILDRPQFVQQANRLKLAIVAGEAND